MSPNSHRGFLNVGEGGYNGAGWPVATIQNEKSDKSIVYARSEDNSNNDYRGARPLIDEPLSRRAWTLQEQILASKMVHFASREMVWECKLTLSCECMQLDRFKTWYALVNEVTSRSITKPEGILPCLSGIAQHFQHGGAGVYLAGLWHKDLPLGLLWGPGPETIDASRAVPYRGPSWSWTSLDRVRSPYDSAGGFTDNDNELKKVYARIIEAKCFPSGRDPLGTVSGGYLKVAAPLLVLKEKLGILPSYLLRKWLALPGTDPPKAARF
ncbi:heterokaryon incompatibility protein-domain-containing protein [Apiospora aurea]|uniref:Heterokaryon incompatibility protein-domain-containing protein n=1 Tax=Apiospora aurea TaxID=335848 RepID=A0ABR1QMS3_9PEZI